MYEVNGYVYNQENELCPLLEGIVVSNWEEAHNLFKRNGIKNYIITLNKIKKEIKK